MKVVQIFYSSSLWTENAAPNGISLKCAQKISLLEWVHLDISKIKKSPLNEVSLKLG